MREFIDLIKVMGFIGAIKYKLGIAKEGKDFFYNYEYEWVSWND